MQTTFILFQLHVHKTINKLPQTTLANSISERLSPVDDDSFESSTSDDWNMTGRGKFITHNAIVHDRSGRSKFCLEYDLGDYRSDMLFASVQLSALGATLRNVLSHVCLIEELWCCASASKLYGIPLSDSLSREYLKSSLYPEWHVSFTCIRKIDYDKLVCGSLLIVLCTCNWNKINVVCIKNCSNYSQTGCLEIAAVRTSVTNISRFG
jgi:hypothetical protein